MGFLVLAVLAVLATATAAATVWLVHLRGQQERDPDATFWYTFVGLCVLAPLTLIPAWKNNLASLVLIILAAASAAAMHTLLRRRRTLAAAAGRRAELGSALAATTARYNASVARWSRYELDPAAAMDFPAMTDVRIPETSALVRAFTAAGRFRPDELDTDDGAAEYQRAVAALEEALATAEDAAGCSGWDDSCRVTGRPAPAPATG